MSKKTSPEVIQRIKELLEYPNKEIKQILATEGIKISLPIINEILGSKRLINVTCKECGNQFKGKCKRGLCIDCLMKRKNFKENSTLNSQKARDDYQRELKETELKTGLNSRQILGLLLEHGHSDIRKCFIDGKQIKKLPTYEFKRVDYSKKTV